MRIAIVNDIVLAAEVLKRLVQSVSDYEVAWIAYDGMEAVQKCLADKPDLILMDLIMPGMGGTEAIKEIMEKCPCAILIVTASVSGNISHVFEAMGYGALDVIAMPAYGKDVDPQGAQKLLQKIRMMQRLIGCEGSVKRAKVSGVEQRESCKEPAKKRPLIVIGTSTGGPLALSAILGSLPKQFPAPIAVVQHVDGPFAENLVTWLQERCALGVRVAKEGSALHPGTVTVAGTSEHMVLTKDLHIHYTVHPRDCAYRPSVDVFFESVMRYWPGKGIGVILTGMGRDGALGLKALKDIGWVTITQDQDSCVVYGMPKAAAQENAAVMILPLEKIADQLIQTVEEQLVGMRG